MKLWKKVGQESETAGIKGEAAPIYERNSMIAIAKDHYATAHRGSAVKITMEET